MRENMESFLWQKEQNEYIEKSAALLAERYPAEPPKACVNTFGCQQNVSDSERIKGMLSVMGYTITDDAKQAQLIIFNTCAVRAHAEDRVFGNIGALKAYKAEHPDTVLALCGCMAQQESIAARVRVSFPYVDMVLGTNAIYNLPKRLYEKLSRNIRIFDLDENTKIFEDVPTKRDGTFRGWLPIMFGCNNFCSYCIVPYVRGRERSRHPDDILTEFKKMVAAGFKDITLLGQNVNSYGKGAAHGVTFAKLLRLLNDVEGDFRIRFMTSHPKDCTDELIEAIRDCEKVANHLHLPFQSGSDRILRQMNRHYDRAKYLDLISRVKENIPDISLTSDIIVGFPGETYEDFTDTISLVREVGFTSLFTFIYSPRNGTPAEKMPDPIPMIDKKKWFTELLDAQEVIAAELSQKVQGRTVRVLCESEGKSEGKLEGRMESNVVVEFDGDKSLIGEFVYVKITEPGTWSHKGILVNDPQTAE